MTFTHVLERGRVSVMFTDKPEERIRDMMKRNGFRWSREGFWYRLRVEGFADFLAALRRALEPGKPDGACWVCKSPEGFFRPYGAATPVYCDECHAAIKQKEHCAQTGTVPTWITRTAAARIADCERTAGMDAPFLRDLMRHPADVIVRPQHADGILPCFPHILATRDSLNSSLMRQHV